MKLEEMLSEISPNPSDEDAGDMLNVALSFNRILQRRNDALEGELAEARDKLTKLVRATEGAPALRVTAPGPRKLAAIAGRSRVSPSSDGEGDFPVSRLDAEGE